MATPLPKSSAASGTVGLAKPKASSAEWQTATTAICHIKRVAVDSVFVMPRTATVTLPYITAFMSAKRAPICSESAPGRVTTMTPEKPTASAAKRGKSPRSLSQTSEMIAANSGAEKLMATAPASGMYQSAMTVKVCETACESPRATCAPGRRVAKAARPVAGNTAAAQTRSELNDRAAITSPSGYRATSNFMMALEAANMSVAPVMQAMPSGMLSLMRRTSKNALAHPRAGIDHSADEIGFSEPRRKVE